MADYVSILNKAIGGLAENSAENRQLIYQKARGAIDRKLRSMNPMPSEAAISEQMTQLEAAINQVEGESLLTGDPQPLAAPAPETASEHPAALSEPERVDEAEAIPAPNPPAGFIDDIILIDGIGEKTQSLLADEGITAISQVAAMSDTALARIADKIGFANFEKNQEWKTQASEMLGGQLPRSKTDQERLKKLKEAADPIPAPNPPERFVDDVILIDGIGEKIQDMLAAEGITGISQVAAISDERLASVTQNIGFANFENTQEWKLQAREMLSGNQPRSKTDQERLKQMREAAGFDTPAAESPPSAAAPVAPATAPAVETPPATPDKTQVTPTVEQNRPAGMSSAGTSQIPARAPQPSEITREVSASQPPPPPPAAAPPQGERAPVEPQTLSPVAQTAPPAAAEPEVPFSVSGETGPNDDEIAFAKALEALAGEERREETVAASGVAPVEPMAPLSPSTGASSGEPISPQQAPDLAPQRVPEPGPDGPEAVAPPPFVSELEGDPMATRYGEPYRPSGQIDPLKPKRRTGWAIGCLAALALLGGLGYAAWQNQDTVADYGGRAVTAVQQLLGSSGGDTADTTADTAVDAGSDAATDQTQAASGETNDDTNDDKDTSRLGGDEPADNGQAAPETGSDTSVSGETAVQEEVPTSIIDNPIAPTVDDETPQATVEVEGGASTETGTSGSAEQDSSAASGEGQSLNPAIVNGEKAYLYEEAVGSTGASRDEGGIVWTLANEAPEPGSPPEAVIKGVMEIPARGLTMNLSIRRNVDPALPASHMIELFFTAPPGFSGGNIDNVSRFVLKASEEARGEGLVAVPARIDTGFFFFALNNLDQAQQTNNRLMENSDWIDVPVVYLTGQRGLVTFEKGESGKEVFNEALADWRNR